jgi:Zn-dependent protease
MNPRMPELTPEALIESQAPAQESSWNNFIVLIISILLFMGAGLFSSSLQSVIILVAVVFIHEMGHWAGMRLFKYRDVKMFFIPFFGAAVTGKNEVVEAWKEVVVLLLGPLPGLFLGTALAFVHLFAPNPILNEFAFLSILLNAINLLPILPMDGGRIANILLFSRVPILEALFRATASILLILIAWAIQAWLLLGVGVFTLLNTSRVYKVGLVAGVLRPHFPPPPAGPIPPISLEAAALMIPQLNQHFPNLGKVEYYRTAAMEIWQKIFVRSPGVLATVGVIILCVVSLGVGIVGGVVAKMPSLESRKAHQAAIERAVAQIGGGDFIAGERSATDALEIAGIDPNAKASALFYQGEARYRQNRLKDAEQSLRECVSLLEKSWVPSPDLPVALRMLVEVVRASGNREAEAVELERKAQEAEGKLGKSSSPAL